MNMKLQIGVPAGCMLPKCVQISGIEYPFIGMPMLTPTAIAIRQIPNTG